MTINTVLERIEEQPLPKRSKTISFFDFINSSDSANADRFAHPLLSPPEDMEWLIDAIKENGNKSLFELESSFLDKYDNQVPPFGFNGLGKLVYARTYARIRPDGTNETWKDTIKRVVEGVFEVQKAYVVKVLKEKWNEEKSQKTAQEMYDSMFKMKFLPPGRGLWAMGTSICRQKGLGAALNNCAFVSTSNVTEDPSKPFIFLMDASMLGVGVGFDTEGAGKITIKTPKQPSLRFVIGDTREGWVESLERLLKAYFLGEQEPEFDYSAIRPAGLPLKTFGGMSSGPEPLKKMLESVETLLKKDLGKTLSETLIVDIMNLIGKCVVAGNVRRTAEIAFGKANSIEFLDLKNYEVNPHRAEYGWTSNNSIFAKLGMDYTEACNRVQKNGEPGFAWLENMKAYSRMNGIADHRDNKVTGGNPCLEQSLESMELCCLVETFPNHCDNFEEYKRTLELALLYAKTVTLVTVHWPETREVMYRNRRIGCSVSGIAQFLTSQGIHKLHRWLELGYKVLHQYDAVLSHWLKIPKSVKLTSVKPSGTISLLAGATPGIHFPESRFYIRRIRMSKDFPMIGPLRESGYKIEPAFGSEDSTVVVEFPVDVGEGIRGQKEVSMWEQLSIAAFMQKHWSDNQVSATITFDPVTEGPQLKNALDYFQYQLKGVSFLPRLEYGAFPQMPYEAIDEEKYKQEMQRLRISVDQDGMPGMPARTHSEILRAAEQQGFTTHRMEDAFCDGDKCDLVAMKAARAKAKENSV